MERKNKADETYTQVIQYRLIVNCVNAISLNVNASKIIGEKSLSAENHDWETMQERAINEVASVQHLLPFGHKTLSISKSPQNYVLQTA